MFFYDCCNAPMSMRCTRNAHDDDSDDDDNVDDDADDGKVLQ